ncbi:L-serine ammonia-lyase, iron-sulfur-dependent, subunit alpha [Streptomyces benahoarensis]|uniref:L-serine ammonia-lyase n=1 Tax=Streptomyces benahoarensis TaxID=2595054 RepID=A0A553ZFJ7_9ACTN|nr:L-serine ammonia-lyase, iron-sulfur-dependent, subunit alpha [Streptomyces benahoarensis]TSB21332.1 serine ammonia-lyase [Streptomyces benahoarensis]TSB40212.1 serine ammonia-lyase [Streptomyces benahoarensis]
MPQLSLLNSVIGPVMRGPSSSRSAGPYHIASTIRQLAAGPEESIEAIRFAFDPKGSFAAVYSSQGSDEGFAAGALGIPLADEAYRTALVTFKEGAAFGLEFAVEPITPNDHPNRVQVDVRVKESAGGVRTDRFQAVSTGGDMFCIDGLNGHRIDVTGESHVVVVETGEAASTLDALASLGADWSATSRARTGVVQVDLLQAPGADTLSRIARVPGVVRVRTTGPSQLCVLADAPEPPTAAELLQLDNDLASWALEFEAASLGLPAARVRELFEERLALMLASVEAGMDAPIEDDRMKYLAPSARRVRAAVLPGRLGTAFMQDAIAAALAVMEQDTNREVVVAAPTAGSAGIVPGTLYALSRAEVAEPDLVDALQVMALVGGVFAARGSFAAETGGCSVETGASAAMAAAGLAHAMGAPPTGAFGAASLCLMNTLGLVCDPAGGEVEIPCHARNVAGVGHAHSSAIAALAGFDAVLPFDHLMQATVEVGRMMHPDLRCTGRAGCAAHCPAPRHDGDRSSRTPLTLTRRPTAAGEP